jgi:GR25 family glycosyltransferase involved in LPS biosynthesis
MSYKVYCINLIERNDRYVMMKNQFDKLKFEDVHFMQNKKHINGGLYGCFESHIMCIKDALKNNLDYCIIMEDDSIINDNYSAIIKRSINFFNKFLDAEILYLQNFGLLCVYDNQTDIDNNIWKCICFGAGCYMLSKKGMINIINNHKSYLENNVHYDQFLMKNTYNNAYYSFNNYLSPKQYISSSDNDYNYLKLQIVPYLTVTQPYINLFVLTISRPLSKIPFIKNIYLNYIMYYLYLK